MVAIRAIYQNGQLKLLEPTNLRDGQEVRILIVNPREQALEALGDLTHASETNLDDHLDEDALFLELDKATKGITLSDIIIEERQTGP